MDGLYIFDNTCSVSFEDLAQVEKLVNGDDMLSKDEVAVKVGRESITRGDMTRLQGPFKPANTPDQKLWLSDTNMNGLIHILREKFAEVYEFRQVYFATTFFYPKMIQENSNKLKDRNVFCYDEVVNWCLKVHKEKTLLELHASYFPIHLGKQHWICAAILNKLKQLVVYNDFRSRSRHPKLAHMTILQNMRKLVVAEFKRTNPNHTGQDVNKFENEWSMKDLSPPKDKTPQDLPEQKNGEKTKVNCVHALLLNSYGITWCNRI